MANRIKSEAFETKLNIAVIFAGGVGKRMRLGDLPKQFLKVHGKPIIVHTVEVFQEHPLVDGIVVSCLPEWMGEMERLAVFHRLGKVESVVAGGATGQESIYNGLVETERLHGSEGVTVLVHDGVRPLVDAGTISRNIQAVEKFGSAVTCIETKETMVQVDDAGGIERVMKREHSRIARAPQSFRLADLLAAHRTARAEGRGEFLDSCTLMAHYGHVLHMVAGGVENIKVTTPDDYYMLRAVYDAREEAQLMEGV